MPWRGDECPLCGPAAGVASQGGCSRGLFGTGDFGASFGAALGAAVDADDGVADEATGCDPSHSASLVSSVSVSGLVLAVGFTAFTERWGVVIDFARLVGVGWTYRPLSVRLNPRADRRTVERGDESFHP